MATRNNMRCMRGADCEFDRVIDPHRIDTQTLAVLELCPHHRAWVLGEIDGSNKRALLANAQPTSNVSFADAVKPKRIRKTTPAAES